MFQKVLQKRALLLLFFFIIFFSFGTNLYAQNDSGTDLFEVFGIFDVNQKIKYDPISPIPGIVFEGQSPETYLQNVFRFGIGLAGIFAVIMLIICGFTYVTTESFTGKGDAKQCILSALGGLLLVFGAWLILNTINPALVKFDFSTIQKAGKSVPERTGESEGAFEVVNDIFDGEINSIATFDASKVPCATTLGNNSLYLPQVGREDCSSSYGSTIIYNNRSYRFAQNNLPAPGSADWPRGATGVGPALAD